MTSREASADGAASNDLEWRVYDALVSSGLVLTSSIVAPSLSLSLPLSLPRSLPRPRWPARPPYHSPCVCRRDRDALALARTCAPSGRYSSPPRSSRPSKPPSLSGTRTRSSTSRPTRAPEVVEADIGTLVVAVEAVVAAAAQRRGHLHRKRLARPAGAQTRYRAPPAAGVGNVLSKTSRPSTFKLLRAQQTRGRAAGRPRFSRTAPRQCRSTEDEADGEEDAAPLEIPMTPAYAYKVRI